MGSIGVTGEQRSLELAAKFIYMRCWRHGISSTAWAVRPCHSWPSFGSKDASATYCVSVGVGQGA